MSQALLQLCQHAQPTAPGAAGGEAPREPGCPMAPPAPEEPSASQLLAKLKYRLLGGEGGEGAFFIFRLTSRLWEAEGAGLVYTIIDQRGKEQGMLSPL